MTAESAPDTTEKDALRREALRHRDRIDPASEDPDTACSLFFETIDPQPGQIVALYWPKGREMDCTGVIEKLLKDGIACALPVVRKGQRELGFVLWKDGDPLDTGPYDVRQPPVTPTTNWVDPDIVVVPMLAFDRRGYRLGYGGGYYDATLHALRRKKNIVAVGFAYAQQAVLFSLPTEDHDERLDWVITPQKAHRFT